MARRAARRDDEHVGEGGSSAYVDGENVLGLVVLERRQHQARCRVDVNSQRGSIWRPLWSPGLGRGRRAFQFRRQVEVPSVTPNLGTLSLPLDLRHRRTLAGAQAGGGLGVMASVQENPAGGRPKPLAGPGART